MRPVANVAPPEPKLKVAKVIEPETISELSDIQQRQLEKTGQRYDGTKHPAAIRLDSNETPESFYGFVTVVELRDKAGKPAFDAVLVKVDSGTIFRAGTLRVVADVIQGSVEGRAQRDLEQALAKYL
jgi:hypothetical protein